MARQRLGGSFAPPLTDDLLARYRALIDGLEPQSRVRDALEQLYRCVAQWWELPESKRKGRKHPVGVGVIVDLEEEHAKALWEAIPWDHELDEMARLFDGIEQEACARNSRQVEAWQRSLVETCSKKHGDDAAACRAEVRAALVAKSHPDLPYPAREPTPLRDAAHHLLWHVRELNLDREPVTNDRL